MPSNDPNINPKTPAKPKSKPTPATQKHPKLYHNPLTLLRAYRDVRLSLRLSMEQHQYDFEQEYGMTITEYLDDIYAAGAEFTGTKLEHHANTMKRTAEMLKLIDKSVNFIKEHNEGGEFCYWILYYTYLSPQKLKNSEEIVKKIEAHIPYVTRDNYFNYRKKAIKLFGATLWGFAARDELQALDSFVDDGRGG